MGIRVRRAIVRNELCRGESLRRPSHPVTIHFRTTEPPWYLSAPTRDRDSHAAALAFQIHKEQMKRVFYLVCLLIANDSLAAVPMTRVIGVIDSHTIAIAGSKVVLRGVDIPASEEIAATQYLRGLLTGAWVYVEDGDVYRSPDALYVNGEMQRHAWRTVPGMRYLGESYPGSRPRAQTALRVKPPTRSARGALPSRVRPRARPR